MSPLHRQPRLRKNLPGHEHLPRRSPRGNLWQPQYVPQQSNAAPVRPAPTAADIQKLRVEIAHLDLLVKKLQTELQIERQYNQALETQIRTLTRSELTARKPACYFL